MASTVRVVPRHGRGLLPLVDVGNVIDAIGVPRLVARPVPEKEPRRHSSKSL